VIWRKPLPKLLQKEVRENEKKKVRCSDEIEFYNEVADDCILHMSDRDKEYLKDNPRAVDYHFSYCMYIRI